MYDTMAARERRILNPRLLYIIRIQKIKSSVYAPALISKTKEPKSIRMRSPKEGATRVFDQVVKRMKKEK